LKYEMAHADNPEQIILATQRSVIEAMRNIILDLSKDPNIRVPGLTWDQIDKFLLDFKEKAP
jgi:hypothetical protein